MHREGREHVPPPIARIPNDLRRMQRRSSRLELSHQAVLRRRPVHRQPPASQPLTLTLSLREREQRASACEKLCDVRPSAGVFGFNTGQQPENPKLTAFPATSQSILPLPPGEGR